MSEIASAEDLLGCGELVDIRLFEISASLRDEPDLEIDEEELSQKVELGLGVGENTIEVRVRASVDTREATYLAVGAMQYRYEADNEPSEEVVREFAERAGLAAVYPYLRESIQTASIKLRQSPVTMPFLPLNGVSLTPNGEA